LDFKRRGTAFGPFETRVLENGLSGPDTSRLAFPTLDFAVPDVAAPDDRALPRLANTLPPGGTKRFVVSLAAAR
jgi:hypothetical protein